MNKICLAVLTLLCFAACSTSRPSTVEQIPQVIAANEAAAMSRLRAIVTAQQSYAIDSGGEFATLETLLQNGLLRNPSGAPLAGYQFTVKVKPGGFEATAVPERFSVTGKRSFFVDESRVLRGADKGGSPATAKDPAI